jgi:hypothetical protein
VVFVDRNGDGVMDAGDNVLRVHQELSGIRSMGASPLGSTKAVLTFRPNGLGIGINDGWTITPQVTVGATVSRLLCISAQGKLTLREPGAVAC